MDDRSRELISDHWIMQKAYAEANDKVDDARRRTNEILDAAQANAYQIQNSALFYTESLLKGVSDLVSAAMKENEERFNQLNASLRNIYDVVERNRQELGGGSSNGGAGPHGGSVPGGANIPNVANIPNGANVP